MDAPISYLRPDFLTKITDLNELWSSMPWVPTVNVPRRECWMNDYALPYTYGSGDFARTYQPAPVWHGMVDALRDYINIVTNGAFDCCFVNGYEHGRQHLGWHADDSPEMDHNHPIAVVSYGAAREIWFRCRDAAGLWTEPRSQLLENGSLLIMKAGMQRNWQHRIPKSSKADCGPRISLTFRKLVL